MQVYTYTYITYHYPFVAKCQILFGLDAHAQYYQGSTQLNSTQLDSTSLGLTQLGSTRMALLGIWPQNDHVTKREIDRHSTIFSLSVAKFPAKKCGTPCPFKEIQKRQRPITKNDNSKRFSLKYNNNAKQLSHDIIKMCFNSSYFSLTK